MIAPGVRQPQPVPLNTARPFILALLAILTTVAAWAAFAHTPAATDDTAVTTPAPASAFRSIAFSAPEGDTDVLYVRSMAPDATPRAVATFPAVYGLNIHGAASPTGNRVAVLSMSSSANPYASLSLVELATGTVTQAPGHFAYLSRLAWAPDGRHVAGTAPADNGSIAILESTADGHTTRTIATFHDVFEAVPVGFSADGTRLYIVTVDKSGSALWQEQAGKVSRVATLSPGRTRDWSLSPDGARLAFVDILGSAAPGYVGRTLVLATGEVTTLPSGADELGPAWQPGSEIPVFGGPGGQLRLTDPATPSAFPVPLAYSPDGTALAATIYGEPQTNALDLPGSLELVSPTSRILLSDADGASFFGWVRND